MASPLQIEANRRNALRSTGPSSNQGKDQSRRNALKHGLAGASVVLPGDDAVALRLRVAQWAPAFIIENEHDAWLLEQAALASLNLERAQSEEAALRAHLSDRAAHSWDEDRNLDTERLAASLARKPSLVSAHLRASSHGCEWLLSRWRALALLSLENVGAFTDAQQSLAHDLLGTPADLRLDPQILTPALIASQIALLERLQSDHLALLDAHARESAALGSTPHDPRPLNLIRRYAASSLRRYQWFTSQLRRTPSPAPAAAPPPRPRTGPPEPLAPAPAPVESPRIILSSIAPPAPPAPAPNPEPVAFPGNRRARRVAQKLAARSR